MAYSTRGGKLVRGGTGRRRVDSKSFRLADEVCYIQKRAAERDGRIVTVSQLILFSTETGDAWLLDPSDGSLRGWPAMATQSPSTLRKTKPPSRSDGRANIASREPPSSTRIAKPERLSPSTDIQPTN